MRQREVEKLENFFGNDDKVTWNGTTMVLYRVVAMGHETSKCAFYILQRGLEPAHLMK